MHHAFTIRYQGRVRVLKTKVGVFLPVTEEEAKTKKIEVKQYVAIWDTGATNSVITKKVVDELGLKPIGVREMRHAGGKSQANLYLVNITLPNNVVIQGVTVSEADLTDSDLLPENEKLQILIGMDIIAMGDFAVTSGNGNTIMSFRIPTAAELDFIPEVEEYNVMNHGNRHQRRAFQSKKGR